MNLKPFDLEQYKQDPSRLRLDVLFDKPKWSELVRDRLIVGQWSHYDEDSFFCYDIKLDAELWLRLAPRTKSVVFRPYYNIPHDLTGIRTAGLDEDFPHESCIWLGPTQTHEIELP